MKINFNSVDIRTWSILGPRGAFGVALSELAKENEKVIALTADLGITSGLERFKTSFPDRFYNVGIAEQNLIGVSAGFAAGGFTPYCTTFSNFAALRSCEQIRHFLGYMKENVRVVGLGAGFAMGMFGTTHYGIEDIAAIRGIPNITILSPADCTETVKAVIATSMFNGPVYIRLTGVMNNPIVYRNDYNFVIGKAITLKEGDDVAIIAAGTMVAESLKAAKLLEEKGVSVSVIDMHTIKPLDIDAIDKVNQKVKLLVTVEEHSIIGGLGSAVAEQIVPKKKRVKQVMIGINDFFPPAGDYRYMHEQCGLTAHQIAEKIIMELKS